MTWVTEREWILNYTLNSRGELNLSIWRTFPRTQMRGKKTKNLNPCPDQGHARISQFGTSLLFWFHLNSSPFESRKDAWMRRGFAVELNGVKLIGWCCDERCRMACLTVGEFCLVMLLWWTDLLGEIIGLCLTPALPLQKKREKKTERNKKKAEGWVKLSLIRLERNANINQ